MAWCLALLSGCGRGCSEGALPPDGGRADVLSAVYELSGVIEDAAGRPVPQAELFVWLSADTGRVVQEGQSDAAGRFTIPGLTAGEVSLMAQGPGLGALQRERVTVPGPPVVLRLPETSRELTGVALADGDVPLPGATVVLGGPGLRVPRATRAGPDGSFRFAGLGPGQYAARVADDALASLVLPIELDEASPTLAAATAPRGRLTLRARAAEPVTGRVVGLRGQALPGVLVEVRAVPDDDVPELVRTDVVGYFATRALAAGRYRVTLAEPGWTVARARALTHGERPSDVELHAARAASLHGRVLDALGVPVAGARITLGGPSVAPRAWRPPDRVPVLTGPLPQVTELLLLPRAEATEGFHGEHTARTDDRGEFRLGPLFPGGARLRIQHGVGAGALELPLQPPLGEAEARDLGTLALPPETGAAAPDAATRAPAARRPR